MQVAYHLGVQSTDEERLLKCLLKNKGALAAEGIHVPGPGKYRTLLREAMVSLRGAPASPEMQKSLLDAVLDDNQAERLVFSNQSFISAPAKVLEHGRLYARAGEKTQWLSQVLPEITDVQSTLSNLCKLEYFLDLLNISLRAVGKQMAAHSSIKIRTRSGSLYRNSLKYAAFKRKRSSRICSVGSDRKVKGGCSGRKTGLATGSCRKG